MYSFRVKQQQYHEILEKDIALRHCKRFIY